MRKAVIMAVLGMLAPLAANAEPHRSDLRRYTVDVPEGWTKVDGDMSLIDLIMASPRAKDTGGSCILMSRDVVDTRKMTQAAINDLTKEQVTEAFWRAVLQHQFAKDLQVETRSEMRDDRLVHLASVRVTFTQGGKETPLQGEVLLHAIPGTSYMAQCAAQQPHFAAEEADIKTVITSYNPSAGVIAKADPAPVAPETAVLTLYAGPRFAGATRALTQDVANLGAAGWNTATAGFALKGRGLWEICDGINYRGNCRVVSGAESVELGGRALRIGSARRAGSDARALLGIASEALSTGFDELAKRAARR